MKPRTLFSFLFFLATNCLAQPVVEHGILDARKFNFEKEKVALNGEWHFMAGKLVPPQDITFRPDEFRYFPKTWNENGHNGQGYSTYAMQVVVSSQTKDLALELPQMYSSYALWINGKLIAANGKVGIHQEESLPQWLPQTISFTTSRDTLKIVLQIANFTHAKGGSKDPIYLSSPQFLQPRRTTAVASNVVEATALGLLGIFFTIIYFSAHRKKVVIYFALLCLTWAVRSVFSNLYVFIAFFPHFNWTAMVRIEYITLFLTMIWSILFLGRIFTKEDNKIIKYLLVGSNCIFTIYTLVAAPLLFTRWLPVYLSFSGLLLGYGTIMVLRAWVNERVGASLLTLSIMLGVLIFSYDILTYEGIFDYHPVIFSAGYILIFSLLSVVVLINLNIIKSKPRSSSVLTYEELYKNNDFLSN